MGSSENEEGVNEMATFFRVGKVRLINIDQIISIACPDPAMKVTHYMVLMADHTVFTLTTEEADELLQVIFIVAPEDIIK